MIGAAAMIVKGMDEMDAQRYEVVWGGYLGLSLTWISVLHAIQFLSIMFRIPALIRAGSSLYCCSGLQKGASYFKE